MTADYNFDLVHAAHFRAVVNLGVADDVRGEIGQHHRRPNRLVPQKELDCDAPFRIDGEAFFGQVVDVGRVFRVLLCSRDEIDKLVVERPESRKWIIRKSEQERANGPLQKVVPTRNVVELDGFVRDDLFAIYNLHPTAESVSKLAQLGNVEPHLARGARTHTETAVDQVRPERCFRRRVSGGALKCCVSQRRASVRLSRMLTTRASGPPPCSQLEQNQMLAVSSTLRHVPLDELCTGS